MGPLAGVCEGGREGDDGVEEHGRFSSPPLLTPLFTLIICILPLPPSTPALSGLPNPVFLFPSLPCSCLPGQERVMGKGVGGGVSWALSETSHIFSIFFQK